MCFAQDLNYNIEEIGCNVVAKTLGEFVEHN